MPTIGLQTLRSRCLDQLPYTRFSKSVTDVTNFLRRAGLDGRQIPLLSEQDPSLDQAGAYEISGANCALTMQAGLTPIGRKIGFTHTKIWSEYNVSEPNWGYLWKEKCYAETRVQSMRLPKATLSLQPRIEPEIVFRLNAKPHSHMTEQECLSCVEWYAHGYEIVVSPFKDWKFTAVDTTAVNALHDRLFIGRKHYMSNSLRETLPSGFKDLQIKLYRDKELMDAGRGSNVLGSPIKALLHLCRMLESQTLHPGLCAGEIITTGTLTKAMPISVGERWSTVFNGFGLTGLDRKVEAFPPQDSKRNVSRIVRTVRHVNLNTEDASEVS